MDKKKIIWISILAIVAIITLVLINVVKLNKQNNNKIEVNKILELSQVFKIDNIEKTKYEIVKNKQIKIASKYSVSNNKYELNVNVRFEEEKGKMIYIRENNEKLNIYQEEHQINKYEDKNTRIEEIMTKFEQKCENYMNTDDDTIVKEKLYGKSISKGKIPVEESIYNENRLYTKTYTIEDEIEEKTKKYDINFYKIDEIIVCEFVYYI